jgi:uncharacterized membrane protein YeaQ/YmgE (transglycosylase-associated protein family)
MGIVIWFVIGGVLGWMASIVTDSDRQQSVAANVMLGVLGALIGGMLVGPLIGAGDIDNYGLSFPSVLLSLCGAVGLLALVHGVRRRTRVRKRR